MVNVAALVCADSVVSDNRTIPISGAKLREARAEALLSQDDLAAKTGGKVNASTIKRIEQATEGDARAFASTLRALASALMIAPNRLFYEAPKSTRPALRAARKPK